MHRPRARELPLLLQDVAGSKVFVYMKGVPTAPQCGFSNQVCRILDAYGAPSTCPGAEGVGYKP